MALIENTMKIDTNGYLKNEFYERIDDLNRKLKLLEKINKKKNWLRRRKR